MHTPTPDPREDEDEPDVKTPPVPPDQEPEVVPRREPPNPAQSPPLIATSVACAHGLRGDDQPQSGKVRARNNALSLERAVGFLSDATGVRACDPSGDSFEMRQKTGGGNN